MKKKPQKTKKTIKVSNEELARMIAEGFASTATREDIMLLNKRIDATKAFLETTIQTSEMRIEGKIEDLKESLDFVADTEVTQLQERMTDAERGIRVLTKQHILKN